MNSVSSSGPREMKSQVIVCIFRRKRRLFKTPKTRPGVLSPNYSDVNLDEPPTDRLAKQHTFFSYNI